MSIGAFADGRINTDIIEENNTYDVEESFVESRARSNSSRLNITRFEQEEDYWCWAAAVQMVADYEIGDASTQSSIVKYIHGGADPNVKGRPSDMVDALKHIDSHAFEDADYWNANTLSKFEKRVQNNHDKRHSTILTVRGLKKRGHSLVVEMSKGKYVELIDPWKDTDNEVYSKEEIVNDGFYCTVVRDDVTSSACVVY